MSRRGRAHIISSRTGSPPFGPVRIQFDAHRIRVETVEKDLTSNTWLAAPVSTLTSPKRSTVPFLFHRLLPIDHLPADGAVVRGALTVGG